MTGNEKITRLYEKAKRKLKRKYIENPVKDLPGKSGII